MCLGKQFNGLRDVKRCLSISYHWLWPYKIIAMHWLRVWSLAGTSDEFGIGVGVNQGSALSPLLFVLVMQEATRAARGEGL